MLIASAGAAVFLSVVIIIAALITRLAGRQIGAYHRIPTDRRFAGDPAGVHVAVVAVIAAFARIKHPIPATIKGAT